MILNGWAFPTGSLLSDFCEEYSILYRDRHTDTCTDTQTDRLIA